VSNIFHFNDLGKTALIMQSLIIRTRCGKTSKLRKNFTGTLSTPAADPRFKSFIARIYLPFVCRVKINT
jgi:hypothetical protein